MLIGYMRVSSESDRQSTDLQRDALQIAIGWSDAHLNQFHIHGKDFGVHHYWWRLLC